MPQIYISPHNKIAYLFLLLTALIFLGLILGTLSGAYGVQIIVTPVSEEVDVNFEARISAKGAAPDIALSEVKGGRESASGGKTQENLTDSEESLILVGQIFENIQEKQEKAVPQATVSMEDYAEGKITLTNNTWSPINFVASTRFSSPEGLIFRAVEPIRIAAKGETTVLVRADKMGEDYEIDPTQFTIPNLRDSNLKSNIIAESKEKMSGGIKKAGIVMQADIDQVKKALKDKLYQDALQEIEEQLSDTDLKIVVHSQVLDEQIDAQAGDEKTEFTVFEKIKIGAVAFNEDVLLDVALNALRQAIPPGKELAAYEPDGLSYRLIEYDSQQDKAILEVQFRGYMVINEESDILDKTLFRGLGSEEIENYLKDFKEIKEVQVRFWPPFILKKAPETINKIKIKIARE
ncbi:hypothetical protein KKG58_03105 [Patescibacteria group bacterium]|nr:hypothetical protein [Patescibacteria group bacterium]